MSTPSELFDLTGLSAIVIGGTGVLCGAMASGLAAAGASVILVGRNEAKAKERLDAADTLATLFDEYGLLTDDILKEDLDKALRAAVRGRLNEDFEEDDEGEIYDSDDY